MSTSPDQIEQLFNSQQQRVAGQTDRLFAGLFLFQWLLAIGLALIYSPWSWAETASTLHIHLQMALLLGGLISALPVYLGFYRPGQSFNPFVIATAQMSYSILLIHITGGRIETHFHVFGSLAFLAFYKDWKVIVWATLITAFDHFVRGSLFPGSIYGVLSASWIRAVEHSAWVVFEDFFLLISIANSRKLAYSMASQQHQLQEVLLNTEKMVERRTADLTHSQAVILEQQHLMVNAAKLSALGEMASGVAHEINTPLSVISLNNELILRETRKPEPKLELIEKMLLANHKTTGRIAKIVNGLRNFSRDGSQDEMTAAPIDEIIRDTAQLCQERYKHSSVELEIINPLKDFPLTCRPVEISQVLLNLLNNAFDALPDVDPKWVRIEVRETSKSVELSVTDCGHGVSEEVQKKLFQPFFTTKEIGKGTGLGLSISMGIMKAHGGTLEYDKTSPHTRFVMKFPLAESEESVLAA